MTDAKSFAREIAHDQSLQLIDEVVAAAWFLVEAKGGTSINLDDVVSFLAERGIRHNINKSRVKSDLRKNTRVSIKQSGDISIPLKSASDLELKYSKFLDSPMPTVEDRVLTSLDFETDRICIVSIVNQINTSHQFELYDCCAVMMRRLAEVLIIDAYHAVGADSLIRDTDGNIKMLNGLINALKSGVTFKLSRNAPINLEKLKTLGDTAAHSRSYVTKKKDIDDFAMNFRMLIEELKALG